MGKDFINKYRGIRINGVFRQGKNLEKYVKEMVEKKDLSPWEKDIFLFIQEWLCEDDVVVAHTSGSTGKPKKILLKKEAMIASAIKTNDFFGLNTDSIALLCLSANYIAGKMMLVRAFVGGFDLIITEPSSRPLMNLNIQPDFIAMVPMQVLNSLPDFDWITPGKTSVIVGGGALSLEIKEKIEKLPVSFYETYGMTETVSHVALKRIDEDLFHAMPGILFFQDERSCLAIDAPDILDERIITNDLVYLENEKQFKWEGRFDNVINSGGVKIMPEKIEEIIRSVYRIPVYVSSVKDLVLGEKIVLVLEEENKDCLNILALHQTDGLSKYEVPKEIRYVKSFPLVNNKIDRITLRAII